MPKLKTAEVYEKLAARTNLQRREVEKLIESLEDLITEQIKNGIEVVFTGFGSFLAKERKSRKGVNPKTGEAMQIPGVMIAKFKAGKNLKEALKASPSTQPPTENVQP